MDFPSLDADLTASFDWFRKNWSHIYIYIQDHKWTYIYIYIYMGGVKQ